MNARFDGKNIVGPDYERLSHEEKIRAGTWKMSMIEPPDFRPGQVQRLLPWTFWMQQQSQSQCQVENHHALDPGEELAVVVRGKAGFKCLPIASASGLERESIGVLSRGDAVWYTTEMGHDFFGVDGEARALFFRWQWSSSPYKQIRERGVR